MELVTIVNLSDTTLWISVFVLDLLTFCKERNNFQSHLWLESVDEDVEYED